MHRKLSIKRTGTSKLWFTLHIEIPTATSKSCNYGVVLVSKVVFVFQFQPLRVTLLFWINLFCLPFTSGIILLQNHRVETIVPGESLEIDPESCILITESGATSTRPDKAISLDFIGIYSQYHIQILLINSASQFKFEEIFPLYFLSS